MSATVIHLPFYCTLQAPADQLRRPPDQPAPWRSNFAFSPIPVDEGTREAAREPNGRERAAELFRSWTLGRYP